jgi:hypothetical protein
MRNTAVAVFFFIKIKGVDIYYIREYIEYMSKRSYVISVRKIKQRRAEDDG